MEYDTQEHLAKAKDYAEAHKMKLKSDALEAWELEQWRNKRQADLCQRESKFKHGKAQVPPQQSSRDDRVLHPRACIFCNQPMTPNDGAQKTGGKRGASTFIRLVCL